MSKVRLVIKSGNEKTGFMPVSMTTQDTCPDACSFKGKDPATGKSNGCYAEGGHTRMAWNTVEKNGVEWEQFCKQVFALIPDGTVWRHNAAGDLPPESEDRIDAAKVAALVEANRAKRGFTYTHYPTVRTAHARHNRKVIADANVKGFTINVSHDSIEALDAGVAGALPSVVVLPRLEKGESEPRALITPRGRTVRVCPAQYAGKREDGSAKVTCTTCGWCADAGRAFDVGFRAHGFASKIVSNIVRSKRTA